jgi:signal peptidase II
MRENEPVTPAESEVEAASTQRPHAGRRLLVFGAVAVVALVADLVSKLVVVANLHRPVRLLGGAIYLVQTRNSGAAFSVGTGATVLLTLIALIVVAVIVRTARRLTSLGWAVSLGLVLGGALGNLSDRLFRGPGVGRGHVVDWISLFGPDAKYWPIFNFADAGIVCGAILAGILVVFGVEFDGSSARHRSRA